MNDSSSQKAWLWWLEIPTEDFDRAIVFSETIFSIEIESLDFGALKMGIFPHGDNGLAIVHGEWYKPGADGPLITLNAEPDLELVLSKVNDAGGKVLTAKKMISPEYGFMGTFLDTEGNRIGIHSTI